MSSRYKYPGSLVNSRPSTRGARSAALDTTRVRVGYCLGGWPWWPASLGQGDLVLSGRSKVLQLLLAVAVATALSAVPAWATHSLKDHVSIGPAGGNGPNDAFFDFSSADGARAFFETPEPLVAGDTDSSYDLYQREGGTTTLISTGPAGGNAEVDVFPSAVSDDGQRAFFETDEPLVAGDTDIAFDVYERSGGTTTLISTGPSGGGEFEAFFHAISADGTRVIFETDEGLVGGDNDGLPDVYQRSGGTTTLLSTGPSGGNGAFESFFAGSSDDATVVFFETDEKLVAGDTDSALDVYQRSGGTTTQVSAGSPGGNGAIDAFFRGSSLDGSRAFFQTSESLSAADTDASSDVYERSGGTTTVVSAPGNGAFAATFDGNSSDGTKVFFHSREQLAAGDTDSSADVYERSGGTTKLISTGTPGNAAQDATFGQASADGSRVVFETRESLTAADTDTSIDVYERVAGTTTNLLSAPGNGAFDAAFVAMSLDGQRVFMETVEALAAGDTDTSLDVYERWAGITTRISFGPAGGNGAFAAVLGGISEDGARVFFDTKESLLTADTDAARDLYVADMSGYPRPKGATPTSVALVPAYRQCSTPNRTHGPPLAFPACNPPVLESTQLTIGSPDANGQAVNASGSMRFEAIVGAPGGVDDSDVGFIVSFTDVRVQGSLADYTGQLQARPSVRITDRVSGPAANEPATGSDVELPVTVPCTTTASTTVGSTCSVVTSFDAVTPGAVPEGKRSIWALDKARVFDGGPDGVASTTPNTLFATQGVFIP